jgi:hypothetical protein
MWEVVKLRATAKSKTSFSIAKHTVSSSSAAVLIAATKELGMFEAMLASGILTGEVPPKELTANLIAQSKSEGARKINKGLMPMQAVEQGWHDTLTRYEVAWPSLACWCLGE